MRKWLSEKLFFWAYRLDRENTLQNSRLVVSVWEDWKATVSVIPDRAEKRKPGRPKGRKDGVGPKPEPKKIGRPKGSKNKPKAPVA